MIQMNELKITLISMLAVVVGAFLHQCLPHLAFLCLEHYQSCTCCPAEDQILLYRYGLDELSQFVERPQARIREYREWKASVDDFLRSNTSCTAKEKDGKNFALDLNSAQVESYGEFWLQFSAK